MISTEIDIDVRLRRNGTWAVAAYDAAAGNLTLIEGNQRQAARIVLLSRDSCTEALVGDMPRSNGVGRANITASLSRKGRLVAEIERIFPNGTYRKDSVQRSPDGGKSNTQWVFSNGSRAKAQQDGARRSIELIRRDGKVIKKREVILKRPSRRLIEAETTVFDGAGSEIGRVTSKRVLLPGGSPQLMMEQHIETGRDGSVTRSVSGFNDLGNAKQGVSSTVHADGSVSGSSWSNFGDHGEDTSYSSSADGKITTQTQTNWNNTSSSSISRTTTTVSNGTDTSTGTGSNWSADDGSHSMSETHDQNGNLVGRSSIVDTGKDGDPGIISTTRVEYNADGSGVIVTTTIDRTTGQISGGVVRFDKNGNPIGPSDGGPVPAPDPDPDPDDGDDEGDPDPDGGDDDGDPPDPDGGDGDGDGGEGGDEMPVDDGGGADDTGPSVHFGGPKRSGGLADFGSVVPPGPYGGGEGDGEGDDVGPARFERLKGELLAAAIVAFNGGTGGSDEWQGGGPNDGASQPVIHFSGRPAAANPYKLPGLATDDWGDLSDPRELLAFASSRFGLGSAAARQAAASAARIAG